MQKRTRGRQPLIDPELKYWIVRLAKENPGLGYRKLEPDNLLKPKHGIKRRGNF